MWQLEVKDFPAVITMDAHGNSLHALMQEQSAKAARQLMDANPALPK
jgi:fumarate hydratase class I